MAITKFAFFRYRFRWPHYPKREREHRRIGAQKSSHRFQWEQSKGNDQSSKWASSNSCAIANTSSGTGYSLFPQDATPSASAQAREQECGPIPKNTPWVGSSHSINHPSKRYLRRVLVDFCFLSAIFIPAILTSRSPRSTPKLT